MKVTGSASIAAPPSQVWDALQDPAVLVRTIPGCRRLEEIGPDCYAMTISAGVASIKGIYAGQVALAEPDPPRSFVLRARGQGTPGTVDATVTVRLSADTASGTKVDYEADAVVGGMIGGVGQRMLTTVAKRTAGEFFTAIEQALGPAAPQPAEAAEAAEAVLAGAVAQAGQAGQAARAGGAAPAAAAVPGAKVYQAPPRPAPPRPAAGLGSVAWAMAAAFSGGGAIALAGVAIGYVMGRRSRG